jgi:hypothetical protein
LSISGGFESRARSNTKRFPSCRVCGLLRKEQKLE